MTKDLAKAAMQFMLRSQLSGQEVPAFNAVMQALEKIVQNDDDPTLTNSSGEE